MTGAADERSYDVGYGKTPVSTRFSKGKSGNPRGRPKGSKRQPPYDTILGQLVTVREDGCERRLTAAEAFLLSRPSAAWRATAPPRVRLWQQSRTLGRVEVMRSPSFW